VIFYEDLEVGATKTSGSRPVSAEEIIEFARQFDPQPFHLDPVAAERSVFGGLVASGFHTAAVMMSLSVKHGIVERGFLFSPGFDDMRWQKPVRPGDLLHVKSTCLEKTPSRSRPDIGSVRFKTEVLNQHGDVVMSVINIGIIKLRDPKPL
jgi:acyl dehydratase